MSERGHISAAMEGDFDTAHLRTKIDERLSPVLSNDPWPNDMSGSPFASRLSGDDEMTLAPTGIDMSPAANFKKMFNAPVETAVEYLGIGSKDVTVPVKVIEPIGFFEGYYSGLMTQSEVVAGFNKAFAEWCARLPADAVLVIRRAPQYREHLDFESNEMKRAVLCRISAYPKELIEGATA